MIETNDPFFSIIIPVYKVEDYLKECLDSVLEQTFKNYECILINDGSPDNCPQICDEYAFCYENISVIHQSNSGVSVARNKGIEKARGDYIIFLDSDDKLASSNCLEELSLFCGEGKEEIVYCSGIRRFHQDIMYDFVQVSSKRQISRRELCQSVVYSKGIFCASLFVLSREIILSHNLFFTENILHEDMEWIPRVLLANEKAKISIFSNQFYLYRINPSSITGHFTPKRLESMIFVIKRLLEMYKSSRDKAFISFWFNMNLYTLIIYMENDCKHNPDFKENIKKIEEIMYSNFFKLNIRNKCIYMISRISWKCIYKFREVLKR